MRQQPPLKIALVHDWMVSPGGAERVVYTWHTMWPEAPIYTAAFEPTKFPEFKNADVRPTWLDKIPLAKTKHQLFTIPRALAFRSLDLSEYDLVLSSCSAESKYVRTGAKTLHICYCHTPIRYYWSDYEWYRRNPPFGKLNIVAKIVLPVLIPFLRFMDLRFARQVSRYIANSKTVQERIKKYYGRDSTVIYPPVDTDRFPPGDGSGGYYLIVGRQVAYKRLDLAVDAFNELGLPLKIAGSGEEIERQRLRAKSNIEFLGRVPDAELPELYGRAKAFIFPPEEDFGIVPVEAMAAGRPVVAFGRGGATETVIEGETGTFFPEQTPAALAEAVRRIDGYTFDPQRIRRQAEKFSTARYEQQLRTYIDKVLAQRENPSPGAETL